jgi:hypothetical protein
MGRVRRAGPRYSGAPPAWADAVRRRGMPPVDLAVVYTCKRAVWYIMKAGQDLLSESREELS